MSAKITIDEQTASAYRTILEDEVTEETYTMYGVSTVLNKILLANGRDKIRSQMMYNYARNGLLVKGAKLFGEALRDVTRTEVVDFLIRYCTRNEIVIKFKAPENPDQLELFTLESVTEA